MSYVPPPPPPPPRSVVSVAGTDVASEDGASFNPNRFQSLGSPTFPHERPPSATPGTRRGITPIRTSRVFGSTTPIQTSRPPSSSNRVSISYNPSLASAFLRPLSSQRLQAQRSAHTSKRTSRAASRPDSGKNSRRPSPPPIPSRRNSLSSYPNTPGFPPERRSRNATRNASRNVSRNVSRQNSRPASRGTEFSAQDHRDTTYSQYSTSHYQNNTFGSAADSTRPLQRVRAPSMEDLSSVYRYSLSKDMRRPESIANGAAGRGGNAAYELSGADGEKRRQPIIIDNDRNWEHFSGNTVFCWGGRLQNTRDRPVSIITAILVILPSILYYVFEASYLAHHISAALPFFYTYFLFICLSSFLHASFTDPGILPRNLQPFPKQDDDADPLTLGPTMTDWTMVKSFGPSGGAMDVPTKYCKSCNIWRPPRAHHCRTCDSCVETQDHHCVWLNNCVGRRNYRYFFAFVSSSAILGIYLCFSSLGLCTHYAHEYNITFAHAVNENRVAFAMFFYGLLICLYPVSLTGYHIFLMARGESTREYLNSQKFRKEDRHRPYDHQNWLHNLAVVLCRERHPTYLRFKDAYIEGDQRFGPKRGHRQAPLSEQQQGGGLEMESIAHGHGGNGPILPR